ncbi:MAG: AraC family transcriptional regulator [Kiloniellales bacterium]|nr:AraC family transcriptional regulator [Kiloniellales bacterium]
MADGVQQTGVSFAPRAHRRRSLRDLGHIARRWGYGYQVSSVGDAEGPDDDDPPITEGMLSAVELPCGVRLCANDLVASCDNERTAIVPRSLTVILELDGGTTRYRLGSTECSLGPGRAAVVTAADRGELTGCYRQGDRSRSLVLQASPLDIPDEALLDAVHRGVAVTAIRPLAVSAHLRSLAAELFTSCHAGPVMRLLAESCALELLARSLTDGSPPSAASDTDVNARDIVRIQRVRDKLVADLAEDHRLCDLARLAGMSASSLKAKFPRVVGQPVFEFLRDQRLDRARSGLEAEGWTVKQAAYFVGYAHPGNFTRAFRRKFGRAPRQARGL